MNKTAIKNFAVWARNKLIADITYRAGLVGVTDKGIAQPLPQSSKDLQFFDIGTKDYAQVAGKEVDQRKALVKAIQDKEHDSDYTTAFKAVIEEVAYTWFNRLIAIRFMEVNDYLPSRVRVLSSENQAKNEPDFVTTTFDTDMEFTTAEQDRIMQLKDENKLDDLFRMLFIKQCNKLHEILPELFENTNDYTELLLSISFTDSDGIVYHLVHDIDEDDFNIEKEGQVEIIGWMYQYYNIEPKDETFALLKKNVKITKERIPAATQLFTPDWIVRYMVENSLGRLWVEGHPNEDLKGNWKYYLEEAEQEADVQAQLEKIRVEYRNLNPEDIKVIDPCMGSGHILVYCFDVLMQIYESQGYTQRDAAQSILENNLFGLDIDKRAAQLSYFAVMMKARQYDRRIFSREIKPHVYAIEESNEVNRSQLKYFGAGLNPVEKNSALNEIKGLLDTLVDAKEYGSILNIENYNWDLLRRFVNEADDNGQMTLDTIGIDETKAKLCQLVEIGQTMAQKYDVVITNPPYMGAKKMNSKLVEYTTTYYKESKSDLFAVFIEKCNSILHNHGFQAMITQHAWMFLDSFCALRKRILDNSIVNMAHLGTRAFDEIGGEVVQTTSFVMVKERIPEYVGTYERLVDELNEREKENAFLHHVHQFTLRQSSFSYIETQQIAYWLGDSALSLFGGTKISDFADACYGFITGDNNKYLRLWFEVDNNDICFDATSNETFSYKNGKYAPCNKGGTYRKWFGNNEYIALWNKSNEFHRNGSTYQYAFFQKGITWSVLSSNKFNGRYYGNGFVFDHAAASLFVQDEATIYYILGCLNCTAFDLLLNAMNPTINSGAEIVSQIPLPYADKTIDLVVENTKRNVEFCKEDWNSFETSWDFKQHPLVRISKDLWDSTAIAASMYYYFGEHPEVSGPLELCYMELCQYFGQKKLKDYATFPNSSFSFC